MLAPQGFSTLETATERTFALKRGADAGASGFRRGKQNGQAVRQSNARNADRARTCSPDRPVPRFRLPSADGRPPERRSPMAARLLRDHLDRPALLFQLRADSDHANDPG